MNTDNTLPNRRGHLKQAILVASGQGKEILQNITLKYSHALLRIEFYLYLGILLDS